MMNRKLLGVVLICIVAVILAVVLAKKEPDSYKIGAVLSVTGMASFQGDPEKKTVEMVAEQINAAGGIKGKKIELIVYDDEGDATKCKRYVKKLITKDKVTAIIGPSANGLSVSVIPIIEQHQVPLISCAASDRIVHNKWTGKPYPWVFKTPPSDSVAVEAIYRKMQLMGIYKIAIMSETSGFGASGRRELLRLAPQLKIVVVADETYDPKDIDMTAQLTKIKELAPQAIVNWSDGPTQVIVLWNWRELGMQNIRLFQSHHFGRHENLESAAGAASGVYCPLPACTIAELLPYDHPQKKVTMQYKENYMTKYNEPIGSFGGHAWDAMHLLVDALKAVGDDKAKIRDYLETKRKFIGQHGIFNFSAEDHNGLTKAAFQMVMAQGGGWVLADY